MSNPAALIGSSPRIIAMGDNIYGAWEVEIEYSFSSSDLPCTVAVSLSLEELGEWCVLLGLEGYNNAA